MAFEIGNKKNGKHYWLTPPELMRDLNQKYKFDFDPCPYPKPENFDGLNCDWGKRNYVNPPFGSYRCPASNKKIGPTAWVRKSIQEFRKGKFVVFIFPLNKFLVELLREVNADIISLGDVKWHAIEDNSPGPGTGNNVVLFVLDPNKTARRA